MTMTLEAIGNQISAGKIEEAERSLMAVSETEENRCALLLLRGRLHEARFDRESAADAYDKVLDLQPEHPEATFHAARIAELYGDDVRAIRLYEAGIVREKVSVNRLLNLAYLYEERGELKRAEACLRNVLEAYPNHFRARHFLRSVESSHMMSYDDIGMRDRGRGSSLMDAPIVDFELSVRSRNCLRQMNIRTLGDLLKVSESELLSYKNFGETSLNEIKAMLSQKGLKLGQAAPPPEEPSGPPAAKQLLRETPTHLNKPVSELELSVRARKCLQMLGVSTLGELIKRSESELLMIKNFGQTSLTEIKQQLAQYGVSFRA